MAQIESLDPFFKLFGRTISVGSCLSGNRFETCGKDVSPEKSASDDANCTISFPFKQIMAAEETGNAMCMPEEVGSCSSSSDMSDEETPKQARNNELDVPGVESKVNEVSGLKKQSQSNVLPAPNKVNKRSDKSLPCPRCSSLNTKFCYFNNYNVKQPRHFCKQCQRYWTAGGSLRNVPFGAGKRKNKQTGSRQLASSDSTPVTGDSTQQLLYTVGSRTGILKVAYSASQAINRVGISSPSKDPSSGAILSLGEKNNICETLVTTATNLHRPSPLESQISQVLDLQNKGATINKKCLREQDESGRKEAIEEISQVEKNCGATHKVPTVLQSVNGQALGCLPAMCIKNGAHTAESKMGNSSDPIPAQMIPSWSNGLPLIWIGCSGLNVYNVDHNMAIATTSLPSTAIGNESSGNLMQAPSNPFLLNGALGAMWLSPYGHLLQSSLWNLVEWNMPWGGAAGRMSGAALTEVPATKPSLDQTRLLGKHSREKLCSELKTEGLLLAPKAMKLDELNVATRESIWTGLGLENKPESIKDNRCLLSGRAQ